MPPCRERNLRHFVLDPASLAVVFAVVAYLKDPSSLRWARATDCAALVHHPASRAALILAGMLQVVIPRRRWRATSGASPA
jgi:hypothetical protein